jgi:hypothetical protein
VLTQLHWQHRLESHRTEFVAQGEFEDSAAGAEACWAWADEVFERRKGECPADFGPMLCTEGSEYFVWAAAPVV